MPVNNDRYRKVRYKRMKQKEEEQRKRKTYPFVIGSGVERTTNMASSSG